MSAGGVSAVRPYHRDTILNMSEKATALLKKALTLPEKERAELASSLIDSLDSTIDEDVEAAWQEKGRAAHGGHEAAGLLRWTCHHLERYGEQFPVPAGLELFCAINPCPANRTAIHFRAWPAMFGSKISCPFL